MSRSIPLIAAAVGLAALALFGSPPSDSRAFQIRPDFCNEVPCPMFQYGVHEDITTEALRREGWSDEAIHQVILGVQGADLFHALSGQYDSRLHFHSNKRWPTADFALNRFKLLRDNTLLYDDDDHFTFDGDFALVEDLFDRIQEGKPYHDRREELPFTEYGQAEEAFYIFGLILHGAEDFYAHTNYLDLKMRAQSADDVRIPRRFELDALPDDIESGFACPCDPMRKLPRAMQRLLMEELGLSFLHDEHNYDTPDKPNFKHARRLAVDEAARQAQRFVEVAPRRIQRIVAGLSPVARPDGVS